MSIYDFLAITATGAIGFVLGVVTTIPVGVGSTLRKTIEVSSSSLTTSKNYWDYLNDAK